MKFPKCVFAHQNTHLLKSGSQASGIIFCLKFTEVQSRVPLSETFENPAHEGIFALSLLCLRRNVTALSQEIE